jgi:hypothetical protein
MSENVGTISNETLPLKAEIFIFITRNAANIPMLKTKRLSEKFSDAA